MAKYTCSPDPQQPVCPEGCNAGIKYRVHGSGLFLWGRKESRRGGRKYRPVIKSTNVRPGLADYVTVTDTEMVDEKVHAFVADRPEEKVNRYLLSKGYTIPVRKTYVCSYRKVQGRKGGRE